MFSKLGMGNERQKKLVTSSSPTWKRAFEAGRYSEIVEEWRQMGGEVPLSDAARIYLVGALSGLGKRRDAEAIFAGLENSAAVTYRVLGRLFLSFSATRHLDARRAQQLLFANAREGRHSPSPLIRACVFIGLSFYRYSYGRLIPARRGAERGYRDAVSAGSAFLSFLASDLLGHCQINLGKVQEGLTILDDSARIAKGLGSGAYSQAAQVTRALYRSTYGLDGDPVAVLDAYRPRLRYKDAYMEAQVSLEIARNLALEGKVGEAQETLRHSRESAFALGNLRLQSLHQLRLSEVHYLRGERDEARSLVEDSLRRLSGCPDLRLELSLQGQLAKLAETGPSERVLQLTRRLSSLLARRILRRQFGVSWGEPALATEDELGDLIDGVQSRSEAAIRRAIETGRFGLLARALPLPAGASALVFGFQASSLTVFDRGEITHLAQGLTSMQREFLEAISVGPRSLEELAREVWRENFSPWRHEKLISSFVSRLRAGASQFETLILRRRQHYFLASPVRVIDFTPFPRIESRGIPARSLRDLNTRQRSFLIKRTGEKFDVSHYQLEFQISSRTALRDLKELVDKGYAVVSGKGKATRYQSVHPQPITEGVNDEKTISYGSSARRVVDRLDRVGA